MSSAVLTASVQAADGCAVARIGAVGGSMTAADDGRRVRDRRGSIAMCALVALVALAGCAGTSDPAAAPSPTPVTPAEGSVPATAAEVLAGIAELGLGEAELIAYLRERAASEGPVTLYTISGAEDTQAWVEVFRTEFPEVDLRFVALGNDEVVERVTAEARAGRQVVDVIQSTAPPLAALINEGLLAPHSGALVPEGLPERYVGTHEVTHRIAPVVIPRFASVPAEDAPQGWDDFLEPEHAGCVFSVAPTWVTALVDERGEDGAAAWFEGFLANGGTMAQSSGAQLRRLLAGEIDCVVQSNAHTLRRLVVEDGAPLDWVIPTRSYATATSVAVHRDTPRTHAAALVALWLASPSGAQVIADLGDLPTHPDVMLTDERLRPWLDPSSPESQRTAIIDMERSIEVEQIVFRLIETYVTPNLIAE